MLLVCGLGYWLSSLYDGFRRPYSSLIQYTSVVFSFVQSIGLSHAPKSAFEVVDERSWSECVGSIWGNSSSEVDVMIDGRFGLRRIGKVRFLKKKVKSENSSSMHSVSGRNRW